MRVIDSHVGMELSWKLDGICETSSCKGWLAGEMGSLGHDEDRSVQNSMFPESPKLFLLSPENLSQFDLLKHAELEQNFLVDSFFDWWRFIFAIAAGEILCLDEAGSTIEEVVRDMNIDFIVKDRQLKLTQGFGLSPLLRLFYYFLQLILKSFIFEVVQFEYHKLR